MDSYHLATVYEAETTLSRYLVLFFFFQAEDGIRDLTVTGVQTCALPISIIGIRRYLGQEAFNDWGWRLPFIISLLLVAIAIYIRLSLQETPIFQEIKAKGRTATNPWREAFLSRNIRYVLIASVVVLGQRCVWYSRQFWALYFLQTVKKVDVLTSSFIVGLALLIATPTLIFCGWLSDKIRRKPIILGGKIGRA